MQLPSTIKVGKRSYTVKQPLAMRGAAQRGLIEYSKTIISVAQYCNVTNRKYPPKERGEIFWHELTHAILADMNSPLYDNEEFVEAFSKRLNDAIHSARFNA